MADSIHDTDSLQELLTTAASHPSSHEWKLAQSYILWRLSRFQDALCLLNSLPQSLHSNILFWIFKGLVLRSLDSDLSAIYNCYAEAYKIDNSRFDVVYNLANISFELDYDFCEPLFVKSLDLNPFNADCWYNYSIFLIAKDRPCESLSALKTALILSPSISNYYCNLGLSYSSSRSFLSAERSYCLSLSFDKISYKSHLNLGSLLVALRRPSEALQSFQMALSFSSDSKQRSQVLFNLSLCHLLLGEFDRGWSLYMNRFDSGMFPNRSTQDWCSSFFF